MTAPRLLRSLVAALLPCLAAFAQCEPQWLQGEPIGSLSGNLFDSVSWDPDGAGPAAPLLVVFGNISAGEVLDASIAAWNGSQWLRLGSPPAGDSYSAVVWNGNLVVAFGDGFDAAIEVLRDLTEIMPGVIQTLDNYYLTAVKVEEVTSGFASAMNTLGGALYNLTPFAAVENAFTLVGMAANNVTEIVG